MIDVTMTGDSCGYTVPFFEFKGERSLLLDRAYRRTANVGCFFEEGTTMVKPRSKVPLLENPQDPHDIKYHSENNSKRSLKLSLPKFNPPTDISPFF